MEIEQTEIATEATASEPTSNEIATADRPEASTPTEVYNPFANGKEKFTVNGAEEEWDWETTKRYAQFGKAGRMAMDKASQTEKKYRETYNQLVEAAKRDAEHGTDLLYQALLGKGRSKATTAPSNGPTAENAPSKANPLEAELRTVQQELRAIKQEREQTAIESERRAVAEELEAAVKKFPILDDKFKRDFVKSEYRKALMNGETLSLEDVAFFVAEEAKAQDAARKKATQNKIEENTKRSPVITPAAPGSAKKKGSLEDSFKMGGLMPS